LTDSDRYLPVKLLHARRSTTLIERLSAQANDLSLRIPEPSSTHERWDVLETMAPAIGAQMLWYVYGDDTYRMSDGDSTLPRWQILRDAIARGLTYGTVYQEIYETDVVHYSNVMAWAAKQSVRPLS
jgi:hypothetical protein